MRKRVKLFYVLVAAFVIAATGMMALNRLDQEITVLEDVARETRLRQLSLQAENSAMVQEIAMKDEDAYIRKMARQDNRYLMPGEIRFVVVNPEALYAPGEMPGVEVVEVLPEEDTDQPENMEDTEG